MRILAQTAAWVLVLGGLSLQAGNGLYLELGVKETRLSGLPSGPATTPLVAGTRLAMGYNHEFTPSYAFSFEMAHSESRTEALRAQGQDWRVGSALDEFNFVHNLRLSPHLKVFATTGLIRNEIKAMQPGLLERRFSSQPGLGLGLARQLAPCLDLTLAFGHTFGKPPGNLDALSCPSLDLLSAGLRVRF